MNELIIANMQLVDIILHKFYYPYSYQEDLRQEGYYGLCMAAQHYDATRQCSFRSYASWWIRKYIILGLRECGQIVSLARHGLPEHIYTEELSRVIRIEDGEALTYEDILPSDTETDTKLLARENEEDLSRLLTRLSDREVSVLGLLYGLDGQKPLTTQEIAAQLNLSVDRVRKISQKSIRTLRK